MSIEEGLAMEVTGRPRGDFEGGIVILELELSCELQTRGRGHLVSEAALLWYKDRALFIIVSVERVLSFASRSHQLA